MQRSFRCSGSGRKMGGGGGMIRTLQRAVRAGVGGATPEPFSASANTTTISGANSPRKSKNFKNKQPASANTALTLSSSSSANNNNGNSAFSSLINFPLSSSASSPTCVDESEWECVDGREDEMARDFYEDYVFGTVPSADEVQHAVSALQKVLAPSSCIYSPKGKLPQDTEKDEEDEVVEPIGHDKSGEDRVGPSPRFCTSRMLQLHGSDRVYDAFHLLETEPSVQRMVISLSSDKAVWDAVLNNDVVKELRGSICQKGIVESSSDEGSDGSNPVKDIINWIVVNGKARIIQLIDKITQLLNEVLMAPNEEKKEDYTNHFDEKLKTSLLLSVVVLLIVVITRTKTV